MKTESIIGIFWLIFGLLYVYQGFGYLYQYSTPGILWLFMMPIIIAYMKIVCGFLSLLIGIKLMKRNYGKDYLILTLTFLLITYLVVDLLKFGFDTIYYSGENILLLVLILISFRKLKIGITTLTKKLAENKVRIIVILIFGFIPYLLAELTTYDFYKFLH